MSELIIKNLHVNIEDKKILNGINLTIKKGEIHALMGPNGSGKSTLSNALMGHPKYNISNGEVILDGINLLDLKVNERAKLGLFMSFQYPVEIPGVSMANFLKNAYNEIKNTKVNVMDFMKILYEKMSSLKMKKEFAKRSLNVGFSGGEKKRAEILQMAILEPKYAILDETDSGLDVDSLRIVAQGVKKLSGPNLGILIITHYQRILHYIKPDYVHIMIDGKIVKSGTYKLAQEIENKGYDLMKISKNDFQNTKKEKNLI